MKVVVVVVVLVLIATGFTKVLGKDVHDYYSALIKGIGIYRVKYTSFQREKEK